MFICKVQTFTEIAQICNTSMWMSFLALIFRSRRLLLIPVVVTQQSPARIIVIRITTAKALAENISMNITISIKVQPVICTTARRKLIVRASTTINVDSTKATWRAQATPDTWSVIRSILAMNTILLTMPFSSHLGVFLRRPTSSTSKRQTES